MSFIGKIARALDARSRVQARQGISHELANMAENEVDAVIENINLRLREQADQIAALQCAIEDLEEVV